MVTLPGTIRKPRIDPGDPSINVGTYDLDEVRVLATGSTPGTARRSDSDRSPGRRPRSERQVGWYVTARTGGDVLL